MEIMQGSTDGWMDKQTMVYTYSGILFICKRNSGICYNVNYPKDMPSEISQSQKDKYWL